MPGSDLELGGAPANKLGRFRLPVTNDDTLTAPPPAAPTLFPCRQSRPKVCNELGAMRFVAGIGLMLLGALPLLPAFACAGTVSPRRYEPCAGKSCGDPCTVCVPGDSECMEGAVMKQCNASGACVAMPVACAAPPDPCAGKTCGMACSTCRANDALCRAASQACNRAGQCVRAPVSCATAYDPCAGLHCGEACSPCAPDDSSCVAPSSSRNACNSEGACGGAPVECDVP